ncbi:hypothetical protein SLEP1_g30520 [Rubroshorea leprosula]|uniref:Uncharacterized protein n=1 Tax=Rubroshorea leprosula TaxID=152421 RepID=A0AAV5K7Y2_9ROSI|nr:hypothetical protein SLEP1_g30520 [Rubroshorea leprosula]
MGFRSPCTKINLDATVLNHQVKPVLGSKLNSSSITKHQSPSTVFL